jgi:hypothetical protein
MILELTWVLLRMLEFELETCLRPAVSLSTVQSKSVGACNQCIAHHSLCFVQGQGPAVLISPLTPSCLPFVMIANGEVARTLQASGAPLRTGMPGPRSWGYPLLQNKLISTER